MTRKPINKIKPPDDQKLRQALETISSVIRESVEKHGYTKEAQQRSIELLRSDPAVFDRLEIVRSFLQRDDDEIDTWKRDGVITNEELLEKGPYLMLWHDFYRRIIRDL